ncbi:hypothetical protein [Polymorphobacter megasporae]|uniref:hypothetical protein n=1 Tax=Glacieibacterium megasporae TaxID=2835787 RepID=UPI002106F1F7|nr:hypothetical protein [Polymorphobacter megasporae]
MIRPTQASGGAPVDYRAVMRDGHWLAHRYDPGADAIRFLRLSREDHARATFITDEYLPVGRPALALHRSEVMASAAEPARLHLVLHSAFCCSTLVARALDVPGVATTLKEPVLLNDIVGCRRQGMDPERLAPLLRDALIVLARPLQPGEAVVVKPSNVVNGLAPAMMAMRTDIHALILHAPLRVFLASVARKGMWGRLWVRELFAGLHAEGLVQMGFEPGDYIKQTDLQIAAVGWLAQQALFVRMAARFGDQRIRTLDSEHLLRQPAAAMSAIATLFGLKIDVAAVVAGPAFTTSSKTGDTFGADDRAREQREGLSLHKDEVDKVAIWAEAVAAAAGIPLALPAPLIAG